MQLSDLINCNSFPLLLGYAEIHYHLKYLFPRYYRKEPEIIADVPTRFIRLQNKKLPILIIIKDAHKFPIYLESISVEIISVSNNLKIDFRIEEFVEETYFSRFFNLDVSKFVIDQNLFIDIIVNYSVNGLMKSCKNDNYPGLSFQPFRCFLTDKPLPFPQNWYLGETHFHSNRTADQVEFGADIPAAKIMAKALGLNWFFVTDHSYDLDDREDDCTQNDPNLPIWHKMLQDCRENDETDFRIIPGEEVSIGNSEGKNVHLLAINHTAFITGSGDSAEIWFQNLPQHRLTEIASEHRPENLFIAAHPFEKVPFLQKLTLRRGNWSNTDFSDAGITFIQAVNSADPDEIARSVNKWIKLLLEGNHYTLLAGNDAHGNFNVMRQIKTPFRKLFASDRQTFGKVFTAFQYDKNDPVAGLKNRKVIIGNGPFLNFELIADEHSFPIGSTLGAAQAILQYECASTPEFGEIEDLVLCLGDQINHSEKRYLDPENLSEIALPKTGYVRMQASTTKGGFVYTNPIWIDNNFQSKQE